jgi:glycosyltransferase involved in cell wall biosynthesis
VSDPELAFTVFTATFNRAHTLPRVYESLRAQTLTDFEWIVVDDGSTDGTRELVETWRSEAPFPLRYFFQENSGKHVAANLAVDETRGRFIATIDSDDWYPPNALETFLSTWDTIPLAQRDSFVGVVGLCADPTGAVIGDRFPSDPLDTTYTDVLLRHRVTGDKAGCGRSDVARDYRFPVIPGESLIIEMLVYARLAQRYRIRCINTVLKVVEYQPTGLSATRSSARSSEFVRNPRTSKLFYREQLDVPNLPARAVARAYVNHTRYALHAGVAVQSLRDSPSTGLWALTFPIAFLAYLRDRRRSRE